MSDKVPVPSVVTRVRVGSFTLHVYAYRVITEAEGELAIAMYKNQHHISKLPARGSGKVFTLFGSNPLAGL